jgi:two-component system, NarL family, response regulator LiaR
MTNPIRILIADDHPVVRDGLAAMLSTQPDFDVVAQAASGLEAIHKAGSYQPDVILLDLAMPDMDGVEALQQLRIHQPDIQVLVFTAFDTDERILSAVQAGAKGYLLKGAPRDELFRAIRVISEGGSLLQPIIASKLLKQISKLPDANEDTHQSLTQRETEVLKLLAKGMTNREIAKTLVITERTVKFHVSAILTKLGASNRTEAVTIAAQLQLIEFETDL